MKTCYFNSQRMRGKNYDNLLKDFIIENELDYYDQMLALNKNHVKKLFNWIRRVDVKSWMVSWIWVIKMLFEKK